jgi:hypothetical protein
MGESDPYPEKPELFDEEGDSMAFGYALGDGFKRLQPRPGRYKSAEANPYYYYPGFILGYAIKVILLIAGVKFGLGL